MSDLNERHRDGGDIVRRGLMSPALPWARGSSKDRISPGSGGGIDTRSETVQGRERYPRSYGVGVRSLLQGLRPADLLYTGEVAIGTGHAPAHARRSVPRTSQRHDLPARPRSPGRE